MPKESPAQSPPTAPSGRFVEDYLLYLLARASAQVSAQFHEIVKAHGLNILEWRVLGSTSDKPRSIGELADLTLAQQPTLTKVVDRMERARWVRRIKDPADGRRVLVEITGKGRTTVANLVREAKLHEDQTLAGYSADEAAALKATLHTLIERTRGQETG